MVASKFNKLFEKLVVGSRELPNRIIFGAHPTNFARNNMLTEQHVAYYQARAKGGAGLIVLEEQVVHPSDLPYEKALLGYRSEIVAGYRQVAVAVHDYGSMVVAQLNHSGMQSEGSTGMRELWAPSPVPDVVSREVPKAMEPTDLRAVVDGFALVAAHTVEGGLDGVEINAAQFSLLRQFMSPLTNLRTDPYGGELDNRLRMTKEVLLAVRQAIGKDRILGLRLCGDEFAPWGGLTPADSVAIAKNLANLQIIDYMTIAVGSLFTLNLTPATHYSAEGFAVGVASAIKTSVSVPVFAEGRIHRPAYAEEIVRDGLVDAVAMNRALIADPNLPAKLFAGRVGAVQGCLSCNQGCHVRRSMGKPLTCLINPHVGVEDLDKERQEQVKSKKVMVIGGGPAGMAVADRLAERGHQVSLWEARTRLGGELGANLERPEYASLLQTWELALAEHQVRVVTGWLIEEDTVWSEQPDTVIVATGSIDGTPPVIPDECAYCSARVALEMNLQGQTILFWDEIGDQLMARTVEKLIAAGNKLYFVTPDLFAGNKLAATGELGIWNQRIMNEQTEIFPITRIKEVKDRVAIIQHIYSGQLITLSGIDQFIYNCWPQPNDRLYRSLLDRVPEIYRVGDCLAPRGIGAAVREGYLVGNSI